MKIVEKSVFTADGNSILLRDLFNFQNEWNFIVNRRKTVLLRNKQNWVLLGKIVYLFYWEKLSRLAFLGKFFGFLFRKLLPVRLLLSNSYDNVNFSGEFNGFQTGDGVTDTTEHTEHKELSFGRKQLI